jgi:hypothetical protein
VTRPHDFCGRIKSAATGSDGGTGSGTCVGNDNGGDVGAGGRLGTERLVGLVRSATATRSGRRRGATDLGRTVWRNESSSIIGRVGRVAEEKKGGRERWGRRC